MPSSWQLIGSTDWASGSPDNITVAFPNTTYKYLHIEAWTNGTGNQRPCLQFNSDTGNTDNYVLRYMEDGKSGGGSTYDRDFIILFGVSDDYPEVFSVIDVVNPPVGSGQEKIIKSWSVGSNTGAGNAPRREEGMSKWINTSDLITSVTIHNPEDGSFAAGSVVTVWGANDLPVTATDKSTITDVPAGTRYEEVDTRKIFRMGIQTNGVGVWTEQGSTFIADATRGVFGGGSSAYNVMQYIRIAITGDATDFGDLTVGRHRLGGLSSTTRGVFGSGHDGSSTSNVMDYITIATIGNATDFGDLTVARQSAVGVSSSARGCFGGGASPDSNVIDYITIDTTGNAADFGDLTVARQSLGGVSSATRGVFGGGWSGAFSNVIDYITIASTGNAVDFGNLTQARQGGLAGASSDTRGVFAGGVSSGGQSNVIDYITIASTGNATDFGDIVTARSSIAGGVDSDTRGVFGGGGNGSLSNVMEYITIDTTGNTTDFGDLIAAKGTMAGVSA